MVGHAEKDFYYHGIKMSAGAAFDFRAGDFERLGVAVKAVGGNGVKSVGYREDACTDKGF